jgi:hypothetical protein
MLSPRPKANAESASKQRGRAETVVPQRRSSPEVRLHRALGNQVYGQLVQAKLTVGASDDPYERQAERVADEVVRRPAPAVQRTCECGGTCEACQEEEPPQPEPIAEAISAAPPPPPDEDEPIQPSGEGTPPAGPPDEVEGHVRAVQDGSGEPLSPPLRAFYESRFGADFGHVRLHTGTAVSKAAQAIRARAFTVGPNVAFRSGAFAPGTQEGKRLLAHELTHVVQQTAPGPSAAPDVQRQVEPESDAGATGSAASVASPLIVDSEAGAIAPGQMPKEEFLSQARLEACRVANEVLARVGRDTEGCPYLDYWYAYYLQRDSRHLERAIRLYVPETAAVRSAAAYIPLLVARLREGVERWVQTGELSGVPEGVPVDLPQDGAEGGSEEPAGAPQFKGREGGARDAGTAASLQAQLGEGQRLGGGVRARMEPAFGAGFSDVRVHTDTAAASLSARQNARAFTVGRHVAFGEGEYRPGTPVGDALLAHELAHVVQQRRADASASLQQGGTASYGRLEEDADRSAVGAVLGLWAGARDRVRDIAEHAAPRLRSGLRLQRCELLFGEEPEVVDREPDARAKLREFRGLYERKERMAQGEEPLDDLDTVNERLQELVTELQDLGVNLDERALYQALQAGEDVLQVGGTIVKSPGGPSFIGQRLDLQLVLDYVPAGRTAEIEWRWRPVGTSRTYEFIQRPGRGTERSLQLQEGFWNLVDPSKIDAIRDNDLEVLARVYLGEEDTPEATITNRFAFEERTPESLSIGSVQEVYVQGQQGRFEIREWAVPYSTHSIDWYVGDERVSEDHPFLRHTFDTAGSATITARIYRVTRSFGIHDKTLYRTLTKTVQVQNPRAAGEQLLARMQPEDLPSLADLETSIETSITESEQGVAQGGEQAAYWEHRLEGQEQRLEALREHAPNIGARQELPEDPTTLAAASYAGPIPAVLVVPQAGGVQPLNIYLTVEQSGSTWSARLIDVTGADVWKFDGSGATPLAAYEAAFEDWADDHPYPRGGTVVYRFSPPGWSRSNSFNTTTAWNTAKAWVDGILTVGGIVVAGLLLMAPEATVTKYVGYILLAATVARSSVAIYENVDRGLDPLDSRNIMEGLAILGAALGVGGTAMRQAGLSTIRPMLFRAGNWTVMASVATDVGTAVLVTEDAYQRLRAIQAQPGLDDGQRWARTLQLISALTLQGVLLYVSNRDLFRGGLRMSDFLPTNPRATVGDARAARAAGDAVTLDPGSRLDLALELRRAGDDVARLRNTGQADGPDAPTPYSDLEVIDRFTALEWMRASNLAQADTQYMLRNLTVEALNGLQDVNARQARRLLTDVGDDALVNALAPHLGGARLRGLIDAGSVADVRAVSAAIGAERLRGLHDAVTARGVMSLYQDAGVDSLRLAERVMAHERAGTVRGLDDWVDFTFTQMNKRGQDLLNVLTELREAERLVPTLGNGQYVNLGGDARAAALPGGGRAPSIDITVEGPGGVLRNIELTTIQAPVTSAADFNDGLRHILDKAGTAPSGTIEATISAEFPPVQPLGPNRRVTQPDGTWRIEDAAGTVRRTGDYLQGVADTMNGDLPRYSAIDQVNIVDRNGNLVGTIAEDGGTFQVTRP